jgi:hypothetical protein
MLAGVHKRCSRVATEIIMQWGANNLKLAGKIKNPQLIVGGLYDIYFGYLTKTILLVWEMSPTLIL